MWTLLLLAATVSFAHMPLRISDRNSSYRYRYLLNSITALWHLLLNKNSIELSLLLFLLHFKKILVLFYWRRIYFEKPNFEMFFLKKLLKKKRDLKKIVNEQLWYRKNHFTV